LVAKPTVLKVQLKVLVLSVQVLDVLCGILGFLGIENLDPGVGSVVWSYGLFMSVVWSLLAFFIAFLSYHDLRTGVIIGALVFSHWVLDFISWTAPLPLMFNNTDVVASLGLSNSFALEAVVEFGALIIGMIIYVITTRKHPVLREDPQFGEEQVRKNRKYLIILWSLAGASIIGIGVASTSVSLTTIFIIGMLIGILCGSEAIGRYRGAKRILQKA
jgi:hypothetical protein